MKLTAGEEARCQFHQHFSRAFFVQIFGAKPNVTRENDARTKNSYVFCWWNWRQEIGSFPNVSAIFESERQTKILQTNIEWTIKSKTKCEHFKTHLSTKKNEFNFFVLTTKRKSVSLLFDWHLFKQRSRKFRFFGNSTRKPMSMSWKLLVSDLKPISFHYIIIQVSLLFLST